MTMETVTLTKDEWTQIIDVLARTPVFPWMTTNPLIQAIGRQLQGQRKGVDGHGDIDSERSAKVEGIGATGIPSADANIVRGKGRPGSS